MYEANTSLIFFPPSLFKQTLGTQNRNNGMETKVVWKQCDRKSYPDLSKTPLEIYMF